MGYRPLEDRWVEAIKTNLVWVIEIQNNIEGVGYIKIIEKDEERFVYLHALYLTPAALGKGLGSKLTEIMIGKAKSLNIDEIRLDSTITAYKFYKKHGFTDNGEKKRVDIGGSLLHVFL